MKFFPRKLAFYGRVLKLVACGVLVLKAADEIRIKTYF
jgi:hypothetical protein